MASDFTSIWGNKANVDPVDLRDEFNELINGSYILAGIGQVMVARRLTSTHCSCWDSVHGSVENCQYCQGESYQWSEDYVTGYFTQTFGRSIAAASMLNNLEGPGYFEQDKALIYLKYDANISTNDSIYRLKLDSDGKIYYPIERIEKWRINNVEDKRAETGKLAYNICVCEREEA